MTEYNYEKSKIPAALGFFAIAALMVLFVLVL